MYPVVGELFFVLEGLLPLKQLRKVLLVLKKFSSRNSTYDSTASFAYDDNRHEIGVIKFELCKLKRILLTFRTFMNR